MIRHHLGDLGIGPVYLFKMIVEELVVEGILRENIFPGGLDKREAWLDCRPLIFTDMVLNPHVVCINQEQGFDLIVEGIEIEVFGNAYDAPRGITPEMFTNQRRQWLSWLIFEQFPGQRFVDDEFSRNRVLFLEKFRPAANWIL